MSKLLRPLVRPGTVGRSSLLGQLANGDAHRIVSVVAPPGYGAGAVLAEDEITELHRRTEGWPVGLYLAALYLREGGLVGGATVSFSGDDRFVSDYVESELLARISRRQRVFLTRTAVLERMCGPLCEAVLSTPGAAATLADLAGSNMLLVPLDRSGEWYRYHHLFRDMLLAQLHRQEPAAAPGLRRRAARWCLRNGLPEEALEYSIAAGDVDTAARLVEKLGVAAHRRGQLLPLLTTHMSFPEIAEELSVSHHTVRSQAYSAYRKLGVSSRSQAVSRSRDLMLLEGDGSHGL